MDREVHSNVSYPDASDTGTSVYSLFELVHDALDGAFGDAHGLGDLTLADVANVLERLVAQQTITEAQLESLLEQLDLTENEEDFVIADLPPFSQRPEHVLCEPRDYRPSQRLDCRVLSSTRLYTRLWLHILR